MLKVIPAEVSQVDELVKISEAAFLSDGTGDGPPEFTNIDWHISMLQTGHLFSAVDDGRLIGGAILFRDKGSKWHSSFALVSASAAARLGDKRDREAGNQRQLPVDQQQYCEHAGKCDTVGDHFRD